MIEEEKEVWKDVVGYEGHYLVSSYGTVRSLKNRLGSGLMKLSQDMHGYYNICLYKFGKKLTTKAHILVAKAFIPNPENKPHVNHKDLNKSNSHYTNLEWVTPLENNQHANEHGRFNSFKRKVYQYDLDGNFIKEWGCLRDIERELGFFTSVISNVCLGNCETSESCGFCWSYNRVEGIPQQGRRLKYSNKKVIQYSYDGSSVIKVWDSARQAARFYKVDTYRITDLCRNNYINGMRLRRSIWKFYED